MKHGDKEDKNYRKEYRRHRYGEKPSTGFLNLCSIDIWNQTITFGGSVLVLGQISPPVESH